MKIILLNGPPHSGKDEAARVLVGALGGGTWLTRFAMPMKLAFNGMMETDISPSGFSAWERIKEEPVSELDVSYRQWLIDFSEKFMKPLYGEDVFVRLFHRRLTEQQPLAAVVADCGFEVEYNGMLRLFGNAIHLVRVHRPGFGYQNDSRSYIGPEPPAPRVYDIHNDSTLEMYHERIHAVLRKIVSQI